MPNRNSKFRRVARGGLRRRPSASMTVAVLALFVALSGGAYAAVTIPAHSVGATQLKTFAVTNPKLGTGSVGTRKIMTGAVTYAKIAPGSVGTVRIDKNEVQARLQSSCTSGQAITAVDNTGKVTCASSGATETNSAAGSAVAVNSATTAATVSAVSLASGSAYEVQANPYITVTPSTNSTAAAQHVVVTCTLSNGGTAQAQRSASFDIPAYAVTNPTETASIPLIAIAASSTSAVTSQVTCVSNVTNAGGNTATNPATVTAQGQIYATGLSSATTGTTPTTTTTTTTSTTTAP